MVQRAGVAVAIAAAGMAAQAADAPSADVRGLVAWAAATGDPHGRAYAIVDKRAARVYVYAPDGRLAGDAPVLLGAALGDESPPDAARRAAAGRLPAHERTTPAGRFDAEPGHNDKGEAIVWVDYAAAVAIHRLRPADPRERRPQRLASPTPADNRISLGCIVVAPAFYDTVVAPILGRAPSVVYVLPDTRSVAEVFGLQTGL